MKRAAPRRARKPPPQESVRALLALYDHSPVGVAALDENGRFTHSNKALQRMLGRTAASLRKLTFNDITHPEDLAECSAQVKRLLRGEIGRFELEKRFLRPDGKPLWAHTDVTSVSGRGECAMIGMVIDITARRAAQNELGRLKADLEERIKERTAELAYRSALLTAQQESSADGVLVVDENGRIVSRNRQFAEMWGIPADVLASGSDDRAIASVLSKLVKPEDFVARVRYLYEHRDETTSDLLELRDGRVFERYSSPVTGEEGRYYGRIWHFRDVTARVRYQHELEQKTAELARSNTELEMYAYAASHDLSAPLRRIVTFDEMLEASARPKLDAAELDYVARIRRSAAGALKLVTDMLTLSRIGRDDLPPENVDLNAVLADVKSELAPVLDGARIEAGPLPTLRAHPALIHSLLLNLLSNAVKFRKPGRQAQVRVASRRVQDSVEISVSDDGIGFDPLYAEKIFTPFLRLNASNDYEGNGIGLAICRRAALRYGGTLTADSAPGRGSTFTLRVPASLLVR